MLPVAGSAYLTTLPACDIIPAPPHYAAKRFGESTMRFRFLFSPAILMTLLIAGGPAIASTIQVPAQQPTIQDGINAAVNGDTVLVAPGTYTENINFNGKAITVKSSGGAHSTIIDGGNVNTVVTFASGEQNTSVLSGFTIQHGSSAYGAGISVTSASPVIINNIITANVSSFLAGGIYIINNSTAIIQSNTITANTAGEGGGMVLWDAGTVTVINNVITNNISGSGGAIMLTDASNEIIVQNLMAGDTGSNGSEIFAVVGGNSGYVLVNNTIVSTDSTANAAVIVDGFDSTSQIYNNLIVAPGNEAALQCNVLFGGQPPIVEFNDAFSSSGNSYTGGCTGYAGTNGNISANPGFISASHRDFELRRTSPAINVGDNSAPNLPAKDLAGKPRIVGGIIDMGAYENQSGTPARIAKP